MILRAILVWCAILLAAIANGFVRQTWLIPKLGETAGHILSTVSLSVIVVLVAWMTIGWIAPASQQQALRLGILWLAMTLAFEFLAGHFLFGQPWHRLLADYNVANGRIWILVLVVTAVGPLLAAQFRGLTNLR
jgi:hypothetical protein